MQGVIGTWSAAHAFHGLSVAGGQIVLTEQYLVFTPWDMTKTRKWLFGLLAKAGAPSYVGKIDELISKSRLLEPVAIPLSEITGIEMLNRASLVRPPTARVSLRTSVSFEFGILSAPASPNINPANNEAFDDWLIQMHQALSTMHGAIRGGLSFGTPAQPKVPTAAEVAPALVGRWHLSHAGVESTLDLKPDGTFTGSIVLFAALPDGSPMAGSWWFAFGLPLMVAFQGQVREPRVDPELPLPFVYPFNLTIGIDHITAQKILGQVMDEEKDTPIEFDRIA